jgi:hypothetical protein
METNTNTGLKLIKKTIERVDSKNGELFTSALKKLVNSNEADLRRFLGDAKRVLQNLALICKILIPKIDSFIVGEKFKHRAKKEIGIQMYIWDNFQNWIWEPMKKKTLSLAEDMAIEKFNLKKAMHDGQIKDELGNPKPIHVTIFLPLLLHLLKQQPNGKEKVDGLLNNGYANIFHVELEDGRVVALHVSWNDVEWNLGANELDYDRPWSDGFCFFSPAT